jgi:hypothetical protein
VGKKREWDAYVVVLSGDQHGGMLYGSRQEAIDEFGGEEMLADERAQVIAVRVKEVADVK